jgi:hypothetical protein
MMQISNGLRVVGTQDDVHYSEHSRDRVNQLLQQESSLLSQLTVVPAKPVPETLGVPVLGVTTAAPITDPLALLKYCLCQDVPDAGTVTSKQLAQSLSVVVLECSVQLHLLQRPDVPAAQSCTDRMRELWLRWVIQSIWHIQHCFQAVYVLSFHLVLLEFVQSHFTRPCILPRACQSDIAMHTSCGAPQVLHNNSHRACCIHKTACCRVLYHSHTHQSAMQLQTGYKVFTVTANPVPIPHQPQCRCHTGT